MNDPERISVVVPLCNEEDNIRPLYEAVKNQLDSLRLPFEVIFVDDGSTDLSRDIVRELNAQDHRAKLVGLSRNFGHQNAISAGIEFAKGAAVIVMDGDLQHPAEIIPEMIARWRQGFHVVYTIRDDRENVSRFKRWTSAAFYRLIDSIADVPIVSKAADFRLMDRTVVDCLSSMPERARFLRGMVSWIGFKQTGIHFAPDPRFAGNPKYSARNMLGLALQGITGFSTMPLRFSACIGFFAAVSGMPYAIWAVYARLFTDKLVPGWASLLVAVLFLGGVQLMCLGIIGEYIGRIYTEVKRRPLYLTEELLGFDGPENASVANNPPAAMQQRSVERVASTGDR